MALTYALRFGAQVLPQHYWLVEAQWDAPSEKFRAPEEARGRHELERLPKMPEGNLVSLEAFTLTISSASTQAKAEAEAERVLVGVCGASELEQFGVRADGSVRRLPALDLEFKQFCFALDRPPVAGSRAGSQHKSTFNGRYTIQSRKFRSRCL